jgi:hypothetical protein
MVPKPRVHWNVVLWLARKPNWRALSRSLSSICFWRVFRITFSNSLPGVDRRLIRRKFCGNFGSLPGFGNVMIFASFQDFGKWDSRRQWLNKCVKCTNGRLGSCLRHSFGMPSIPQDFLNFKELINICKSRGLILSGACWLRLLNSSLHPPFIVFVTQIMVCELIFQAVSNYAGFLRWKKFKAWRTMNGSWCPWSISL